MNHTDLEDEFIEIIRKCCSTEDDKEKAKKYFYSVLVNDLIDEALKD